MGHQLLVLWTPIIMGKQHKQKIETAVCELLSMIFVPKILSVVIPLHLHCADFDRTCFMVKIMAHNHWKQHFSALKVQEDNSFRGLCPLTPTRDSSPWPCQGAYLGLGPVVIFQGRQWLTHYHACCVKIQISLMVLSCLAVHWQCPHILLFHLLLSRLIFKGNKGNNWHFLDSAKNNSSLCECFGRLASLWNFAWY